MSLSADDVDAVVVEDGRDDRHDTTDHSANVWQNQPRSEKGSRFCGVILAFYVKITHPR